MRFKGLKANYSKHIDALVDLLLGKELRSVSDINIDELKFFAKKNKCVDVLIKNFQFKSNGYLKSEEINNLARVELRDKLLSRERKLITQVFKINQVAVVDLNLRKILCQKYDDSILAGGSDIDILVKKEDLKIALVLLVTYGYKIKNFPPQEIAFYNSEKNIEIDLHYYACVPRDYSMSTKIASNFTHEFIDHSSNNISLEHLLLANIARYWNNEFLRGLRNLRDIGLLSTIKNGFSWVKFVKIAKRYNLLDKSMVIFLMNKKIFHIEFPKHLVKNELLHWRASLVANYYSKYRVGLFSDTLTWFDSYHPKTRSFFIENFIASLIADRTVPLSRLIRVRIILFALRSFF